MTTDSHRPERLPLGCEAFYIPDFLDAEESQELFDHLCANFEINDRKIPMADGTEQIGSLGTFLFADEDLIESGAFPPVWGRRAPWPNILERVKKRIEKITEARFQVARSVYYANGFEGMDYHSDLPAYGPTDQIASLSLGAEREFLLRENADHSQVHRFILTSGSLFFMGPGCQENYEHAIVENPLCESSRINLTFRKFTRGT